MRAIGAAVGAGLVVFLIGAGLAEAAGDAAKGKAVYQKYCVSCHGGAGKGDGPMGPAMNPKLKDLSDKGYNQGLKEDYLAKLFKEGGAAVGKSPMMPKLGGSLKDSEVADLIAFVRTLAK